MFYSNQVCIYSHIDLQGRVTSSVMWPFDSPYAILLVSHWNRVSIFNRFRNIWTSKPVRVHTRRN